MTNTDPTGYCPLCGQTYYLVNGHNCQVLDRLGGFGWPTQWTIPALPTPGWVCPRCQRVYGPNVPECHYCNQAVEAPRPDDGPRGAGDSPTGERR